MFISTPRLLLAAVFCAVGLSACQQEAEEPKVAATASEAVKDDIPYGQLPRDVLPTAYQLTLTIVPEEDGFSGISTIDMEFTGSKDYFYLHGKDLTAGKVHLTSESGSFEGSYEQVDDSGIVKISSPQPLQGKVRVEIEYSGLFNQALDGLYKVSESGKDYAFTQFEAIAARLAFPGFDEPDFKTPFDITLIVPENEAAISNTPDVSSEIVDGMKHVKFAPTKPLPTYLIAFAVGDFDVVEWEPLPPTEIRPWPLPLRGIAVKGKGSQLDFALEGTNQVVVALENYFGTPYPWKKLDILAVPDFSAGAMENAGAITYRESLLLFDDTATPARKRSYTMVHAHELAHQWFGDLVTPVWWNDIWLNESFATWMSYTAMETADPSANYRRDLLSGGIRVMESDSLVNARQIRQPILSNDDIATAFDGITYQKGGAVLAMFENFLGPEDFRQGVRNYMEEFKYGTATADDFIRNLAAASTTQPKDVVIASFNSFLEQPGLPLVDVASQCDDNGVTIVLKQSRYLPLGSSGDRDQQWDIPVCMRLGSGGESSTTCLMLSEPEQSFELQQSCPDWINPNADSAGYYRFSMDAEAWNTLLANGDQQNTNEMMAILGSLTGAFNSGDLEVGKLMSIVPQLIASPDWQVSTAPIAHMQFMYDRMASEGQKEALESRFADFYADKMKETGLEVTADRDEAQLQAALVKFLAETAKQPDLREELLQVARAYTGYGTDNQIHPEAANPIIVATALIVAVEELGNDFIDHLQALALNSTDAVVRGRALSAIGNTKDPEKSAEVRQLVFSQEIRDNEVYNIMYPQMFMDETRDASWAWFEENMDQILERYPEDRWGRFAFYGTTFCNAEKKAAVQAFYADKIESLTGGPRTLANTLESIDLCMAKVQQHKPELDAWLGQ